MSKYIKLFNKALGLPNPIERSRFELETNKNTETEDGGETPLRQLDSTSTTSSEEEEASTTESETRAITFNQDIYILTGKKGR